MVRPASDRLAAVQAVRAVVAAVDPDQPLTPITSLGEIVDGGLQGSRFQATLFGLFSLLAVGLALVGLCGVLNYLVGERRREIGIRVAVGARRHEIFAMVVGTGARLVAVGLVVGAALTWLTARLLAGLLYGIAPWDPPTWALSAALLAAVALLASALPAARALRVDPVKALRSE